MITVADIKKIGPRAETYALDPSQTHIIVLPNSTSNQDANELAKILTANQVRAVVMCTQYPEQVKMFGIPVSDQLPSKYVQEVNVEGDKIPIEDPSITGVHPFLKAIAPWETSIIKREPWETIPPHGADAPRTRKKSSTRKKAK